MNDYNSILKRLKQKVEDSNDKRQKTWFSNNEKIIKAVAEKGIDYYEIAEQISKLEQLLDNEASTSQLRGFYSRFMRHIVKEYGLVPPKYYQTQWMAIGMAAFGLPFGIIFATAIGNLAFMSIGMPLGLPIGMAVGAAKDKKAEAEGKVLTM